MMRIIQFILYISTLSALFFIMGCDEDKNIKTDIVGVWFCIEDEESSIITTNSNQQINNPNQPGTSEITISGSINTALGYISVGYDGNRSRSINIMNQEMPDPDDEIKQYPYYNLWIHESYIYNHSTYRLSVWYSHSDVIKYCADSIQYSFDPVLITFSIDSSIFYRSDDATCWNESDQVVINGVLGGAIINIPANTPTEIQRSDEGFILGYFSELMITMDANGTWHREQLFDDDEIILDEWTGTWETINNQLLAIENYTYEDDDSGEYYDYKDTLVFEYTIVADTLNLSIVGEDEDISDTSYWFNIVHDIEWGVITESVELRKLRFIKYNS